MKSRDIFNILKKEIAVPEGKEKSPWNKMLYAVSQKLEKEIWKEINEAVKRETGIGVGLKRLEPMDAEERKQEILLMIDEQIDQRNTAGIERLMTAIDKVYGLSGDSMMTIKMVDFCEAFPDLAYAKEVFETAMSTRETVIETESK